MARNPKFDEAKRRLDAALGELSGDEERPAGEPGATPADGPPPHDEALPQTAAALPAQPAARPEEADGAPQQSATPRPAETAAEPVEDRVEPPEYAGAPSLEVGAAPPTTEALARLVVGAALLGLDGLAARSARWEAEAGIRRPSAEPPAAEGAIGSARFRHALIGWVFEAEEQLRPRGNPIGWLRAVVAYAFGTVFSVVLEMLPLPRVRRSRGTRAEPSDEEILRWSRRGQAEEERSRRFARAAIGDIADATIIGLARRPAVGQALGELVRTPAMDDAVRQIVAGPVVDETIARVAQSPAFDQAVARVAQSSALDEVVARVAQSAALDQAVAQIVRTPAMEDAVRYLVATRAMNEAIDTLAKSPALVDLVTTQSTSVAFEVLGEVRERAVSADKVVEGMVRRLLRRPPRARLPLDVRGLPLPPETPAEQQTMEGDGS